MRKEKADRCQSEPAVWFWIVAVFMGLIMILGLVLSHDRHKPSSPQALVASGFKQLMAGGGEPNMPGQPCEPTDPLVWKPLPPRPVFNPANR